MGSESFVFDLGMLSAVQVNKFVNWVLQVRLPDEITCKTCNGAGSWKVPGDMQDGKRGYVKKCWNCKEKSGKVKNPDKKIASTKPIEFEVGLGRRVKLLWDIKNKRFQQETWVVEETAAS